MSALLVAVLLATTPSAGEQSFPSGQRELGVTLAGAVFGSRPVEPVTGSATNTLLNPGIVLGIMLGPRVEARVALSYVHSYESNLEVGQNHGQVALQAMYLWRLRHLTLTMGLGLAGSAGENFTTGCRGSIGCPAAPHYGVFGAQGGAQGLFGVLVEPMPRLSVRAHLRVDFFPFFYPTNDWFSNRPLYPTTMLELEVATWL